MEKFNSNSEDCNLPQDFVKIINEVNLNAKKAAETFVELQDFICKSDLLLMCLLANLNLLQMNCFIDVIKLDDSDKKNFDEIVQKPIDDIKDLIKCYRDGRTDISRAHFHKILDLTQEIIERTSAFKLSTLDQKRDHLDSLFRLPDADKD